MFQEPANQSMEPGALAAASIAHAVNHKIADELEEAIALLWSVALRSPDSAAPALLYAAHRLDACAEHHRSLQQPPTSGRTDLGLHVEHVCASLSRAFLVEERIALTVCADEIWVDAAYASQIGLLASELIVAMARLEPLYPRGDIRLEIRNLGNHARCLVDMERALLTRLPDKPEGILARTLAAELTGAIQWKLGASHLVASFDFPTHAFAASHAGARPKKGDFHA